MPPDAEATGQPYDEAYYRETYGRDLARRLPRLTREQYWAHWLERRIGRSAGTSSSAGSSTGSGSGPIIDLGSGLGWLALSARERGLASISLDISEFSAQRLRREHGLRVIVGSAIGLPVRAASIAAVVALDVLEHVGDPRAALREIHRALRADGLVVISVPNTSGYGARSKRASGTWFGDRDPTHTALWAPDEWVRALVDSEFMVVRKGSDLLWDVPYPVRIPAAVQRAVLLPLHRGLSRAMGALPWNAGENLVLVGRAS